MISHARNRLFVSCVAFAFIGIASVSFAQTGSPPAQSEQDHEAHHPPVTTQAPTPPEAQPGGMSGMMGMMGGDVAQMMVMMRNMMTMMSAQSGSLTPLRPNLVDSPVARLLN